MPLGLVVELTKQSWKRLHLDWIMYLHHHHSKASRTRLQKYERVYAKYQNLVSEWH